VATLEAQLALAALRLWIDPADSLARAQLARWLDEHDDGEAWLEAVLRARGSDELFSDLEPVVALREAREPRAFSGVLASFDAALAAVGVRERAVTFGDATARLANLDALRALAASYVDRCRSDGTPCSLRGLFTHLEELANELLDTQAAAERPDAVRICTLHSAKGLEWPVTVLADLTNRPDASALGVRLVSESEAIDLEAPLAGRWICYWPSPYGGKRKDVPLLDRLDADEASQVAKAAARREALRLVYVSWTRARDRLVYAGRPRRVESGSLTVLSAGGAELLSEPDDEGRARWGMPGEKEEVEILVRKLPPERRGGRDQRPAQGYAPAGPRPHPPATVNPSRLGGKASVGEAVEIGTRIPVAIRDEDEMRRFGDAVHAFFAADRATLPSADREALARGLLERFAVAGVAEASQLPLASDGLNHWIESNWPGANWLREWPIFRRLPEGTLLRGVADLVIETEAGLVLLDHNSFPGNREQAAARAAEYAGQLSAYVGALEAATGKPLIGAYIHLPVSGLAVPVELSG
jgi:ATP-dependent exoDNAse (exonuclease V) beta subunit